MKEKENVCTQVVIREKREGRKETKYALEGEQTGLNTVPVCLRSWGGEE